jgi:SMODS and SLOG-associating 2TM effector domain 2
MWTWADIRKRFSRSYNIVAPKWNPPSWKQDQVAASLDSLRQYAENDVQAAIDWYFAKKPWKATASQGLKLLTLAATGIGGLMPIVSATGVFSRGLQGADVQIRELRVDQCGYLCFGLAAAFLAFDKYFGYSTGWMRYMTTAMALDTALRNFRLDWAKATSTLAGAVPSGPVLETLLQKIQDFCVAARTIIEKETQAWVAEFQTNLNQLEKEAKAAMDNARTTVEAAQKEAKAAADSVRPGAIDLTVENVLETDHGYTVSIDGETRKEGVTSKTCAIMNVPPGLHEMAITATLSGNTAHDSQSVNISPGAAAKVSVTLAKAKAVAG